MNRLLIIICALVLFSCKSKNSVINQKEYVVYTIRKTDCRGKCPVYLMEIYSSGKAIFDGTKNTTKIGVYQKMLDSKTMKQLKQEFEQTDYFGFKDEYTAPITDLPTTYTSFTIHNTTKKIRNYSGAPEELLKLEKLLEDIAQNNEDWIQKK